MRKAALPDWFWQLEQVRFAVRTVDDFPEDDPAWEIYDALPDEEKDYIDEALFAGAALAGIRDGLLCLAMRGSDREGAKMVYVQLAPDANATEDCFMLYHPFVWVDIGGDVPLRAEPWEPGLGANIWEVDNMRDEVLTCCECGRFLDAFYEIGGLTASEAGFVCEECYGAV